MIEVIAPQGGVAARGEHFKNALGEFQQRHVKGAAPEVIDEIKAFRGVIKPVGERRSRRFIQKPQNVKPRQTRRVLGGLALRVVKVRGHRNHGPHKLPAEARFSARFQGL